MCDIAQFCVCYSIIFCELYHEKHKSARFIIICRRNSVLTLSRCERNAASTLSNASQQNNGMQYCEDAARRQVY